MSIKIPINLSNKQKIQIKKDESTKKEIENKHVYVRMNRKRRQIYIEIQKFKAI